MSIASVLDQFVVVPFFNRASAFASAVVVFARALPVRKTPPRTPAEWPHRKAHNRLPQADHDRRNSIPHAKHSSNPTLPSPQKSPTQPSSSPRPVLPAPTPQTPNHSPRSHSRYSPHSRSPRAPATPAPPRWLRGGLHLLLEIGTSCAICAHGLVRKEGGRGRGTNLSSQVRYCP